MLCAKFEQTMHQLGFAAWFLRDFEATQGRELHINISNFTRALADTIQQLNQFFLIPVRFGGKLFDQGLQAACRGAKAVDALRRHTGGQIGKVELGLLKSGMNTISSDSHTLKNIVEKYLLLEL